ncbi:unnamed protein product [Didymodactylos carnosus]|uniref:ORM1-like protein n=1 Tax=Didymodactylos carnosus TaxID=1234261 RepID=A0A813RL29_9BILA|nr:unnamed protein product [Didymodactylos carnosus]CAF0935420.1 unnamed protein product [Didymodactylos carnosus]CAF3566021.1 unnamed protein product [Didymodactylos carnosus]CAF3711212.1 unnamed protein product [Didymodactylos carnosus]
MDETTIYFLMSYHLHEPLHSNPMFIVKCMDMNVGIAQGERNPNSSWLNSRGVWLTYIILLFVLHFILLSIPYITTPLAWTLTTSIHNIVNIFYLFHIIKGAPWETSDQGMARRFTFWEQIDDGVQWTGTRKFVQIIPIVLFFIASFYTQYNGYHFLINLSTLLLAIIPKLPIFHGVRIMNINRY